MMKGELLNPFFEVKTDLGCSSIDGGIGSMQKRMTQNNGGLWVLTHVQYYEICWHI